MCSKISTDQGCFEGQKIKLLSVIKHTKFEAEINGQIVLQSVTVSYEISYSRYDILYSRFGF